MFEKMTDDSRQCVVKAQDEAKLLVHNYIGTEHLLLGILARGNNYAAAVLHTFGVTLEAMRDIVQALRPSEAQAREGRIPFTPRAKKVLELAQDEALRRDKSNIHPEHLLLAILAREDTTAREVLAHLRIDLVKLEEWARLVIPDSPSVVGSSRSGSARVDAAVTPSIMSRRAGTAVTLTVPRRGDTFISATVKIRDAHGNVRTEEITFE